MVALISVDVNQEIADVIESIMEMGYQRPTIEEVFQDFLGCLALDGQSMEKTAIRAVNLTKTYFEVKQIGEQVEVARGFVPSDWGQDYVNSRPDTT